MFQHQPPIYLHTNLDLQVALELASDWTKTQFRRSKFEAEPAVRPPPARPRPLRTSNSRTLIYLFISKLQSSSLPGNRALPDTVLTAKATTTTIHAEDGKITECPHALRGASATPTAISNGRE